MTSKYKKNLLWQTARSESAAIRKRIFWRKKWIKRRFHFLLRILWNFRGHTLEIQNLFTLFHFSPFGRNGLCLRWVRTFFFVLDAYYLSYLLWRFFIPTDVSEICSVGIFQENFLLIFVSHNFYFIYAAITSSLTTVVEFSWNYADADNC